MKPPETPDLTDLLVAWHRGDEEADQKVLETAYRELHGLAIGYMRGEREDHTLQPTALLNEAYLRLQDQRVPWQSRSHFYGVAAQLMRRILVDYARRKRADRRGGGIAPIPLADVETLSVTAAPDVLALDEALRELKVLDPEKSHLVELRFFGGLEMADLSEVLGVSPSTVARRWRVARSWLFRRLSEGGSLGN